MAVEAAAVHIGRKEAADIVCHKFNSPNSCGPSNYILLAKQMKTKPHGVPAATTTTYLNR